MATAYAALQRQLWEEETAEQGRLRREVKRRMHEYVCSLPVGEAAHFLLTAIFDSDWSDASARSLWGLQIPSRPPREEGDLASDALRR